MKRLLGLAAASLALAPLVSNAAQPNTTASDQHWYAVEIIVFRPATNMAGNSETWPATPKLPDVTKAVVPAVPGPASTAAPAGTGVAQPSATTPLQTATTPPAGDEVLPLPATQYQLDDVWNRLQSSGRYVTLLHTGWIEQGQPRAKAPAVSITPLVTPQPASVLPTPVSTFGYAGSTPLPAPQSPGSAQTPLPSPSSHVTAQATSLPPQAPADAPVFGTVTLSLNRYLHLGLDLAYRPADAIGLRVYQQSGDLEAPQNASAVPATAGFGTFPLAPSAPTAIVLDQSRRIQTGNLNYFDNPLFGAIVQVTPVPAPADANASP